MNENLLMLLKTLLSDEKLAARFAKNKTLDEFFEFCISIVSGYTKDELDAFLKELASLISYEDCDKIALEKNLEKVSGGISMKKTNEKILAGAMAIVSLISPLSVVNQGVQASSPSIVKERVKEGLSVGEQSKGRGTVITAAVMAVSLAMLAYFRGTNGISAPYTPAPGGLPNLGESCYMNASIQSLFFIEAFRDYVLSYGSWSLGIGGDAWIKALKRIFQIMDQSIKTGKLIALEEIEGPLRNLGYADSQEDATEFIYRGIMNSVGGAFGRFFTPPLAIVGRAEGVQLGEILRTGGLIDLDVVHGEIARQRPDMVPYDSYSPDSVGTWNQLRTAFLEGLSLADAYRYNRAVELHPVKGQFGILLNRTHVTGKLTIRVQIPNMLTIPGWFGETQYELTAVTVHQGERMDSSHYYTYIRERIKGGGGKWSCHEDSSISEVTNIGAMQSNIEHNGVILVYSQIL